jgi:hypothetical protein
MLILQILKNSDAMKKRYPTIKNCFSVCLRHLSKNKAKKYFNIVFSESVVKSWRSSPGTGCGIRGAANIQQVWGKAAG